MSDFMRTVVEEVLYSRSSKKKDPARAVQQTQPVKQAGVSGKAVPEVNRPNYQRDKTRLRLGSHGGLPRDYVEQSLSPLLRMSLVQGRASPAEPSTASSSPSSNRERIRESGMVGQISDEQVSAWYYPNLHPTLASSIGHYSSHTHELGIITAERSMPGYIVILDELAGSMKPEITFEKAGSGPFAAKLIDKTNGQVLEVLERFMDKLNQQTGSIRLYPNLPSTPLLSKFLGVRDGEYSVIIEGVNRYRSIALLDRAMKHGMDDRRLQLRIEEAYMIASGEAGDVADAVSVLRRIVEPYL